MQNNKMSFIISLSVSLVIAIVASFIFGFFGAKLSFDWSGGNQIKIECESNNAAKESKATAISILKDNKISIYSTEEYTNGATQIVVIRTQKKAIKSALSNNLLSEINAIDGATTEGIQRVYSNYSGKIWLIPFVPTILALVSAVALYFITKRFADLIALFVSYVATGALILSLLVLTRTELGTNSVAAIMIGTLIQTALAFALLLSVKKEQNSLIKSEQSLCESCKKVAKDSFSNYGLFFVTVMAASVVSVCVGNRGIMNFGIMLLLSLAIAMFVSYFIMLELKVVLENVFQNRYSRKMNEGKEQAKPENKTAGKKTVKRHK